MNFITVKLSAAKKTSVNAIDLRGLFWILRSLSAGPTQLEPTLKDKTSLQLTAYLKFKMTTKKLINLGWFQKNVKRLKDLKGNNKL